MTEPAEIARLVHKPWLFGMPSLDIADFGHARINSLRKVT
jgi:hypothetical protein